MSDDADASDTDAPDRQGMSAEPLDVPEDVTPLERLRAVMARLRDPVRGCDWDVAQSFATIAPFTIEEAYEVADAIDREDLDELRDELGDLLLQVVFHARMAEELGAFDFDDVARAIVAKMIRRHPHVFGDTRFASDAERQAAWESAKATERAARAAGGARARRSDESDGAPAGSPSAPPPSALDGVAMNLPALARADKVQRRAARVGFDWPDIAPVRAKLLEELAEVDEAASAGSADALEDEAGDLLFAAVNLARHHGIDAETALRRATRKFERRFRQVETFAGAEGTALEALDIDGLDALWNRAKRSLG